MQPDHNGETLLDYAELTMFVSKPFLQHWQNGGQQGSGIVQLSDSSVQIISDHASLENITMSKGDLHIVSMKIDPFVSPDLSGGPDFYFEMSLYDHSDLRWPSGTINYVISKDSLVCETCDDLQAQFMNVTDSIITLSGTTAVQSGDTLEFSNSKLEFEENAKIEVHPGGKLIIDHCELRSACKRNNWHGIHVLKNHSVSYQPLLLTNSIIRHTGTAVSASSSSGILIQNNVFVGRSTEEGTAIRLDSCGEFILSGNRIAKFKEGINTGMTFSNTTGSLIERNFFEGVQTCLHSSQDNHSSTDFQCNRFGYFERAIVSDSSVFKNFGSQAQAAGNRFYTQSSLSNNKLYKTGGNSPLYYYDSTYTIAGGMNITLATSSAVVSCSAPGGQNKIISSIEKESTEMEELLIIPNPNNGNMTIRYSFRGEGEARIIITDLQGREIKSILLSESSGNVVTDLQEWAGGVYLVTLVSSNGVSLHAKAVLQD
jgi:hypothetical protein